MRSQQIYRTLSQGINRFEVCQLVAKGVRRTHKTGSRFEDSINNVLDYLGANERTQDSLHTPGTEESTKKSQRPAA